MKNITILGSTGSVGKNVMDVIRNHPDKFRVKAITAKDDIASLISQVEEFSPSQVVISDDSKYSELRKNIPSNIEVLSGEESLKKIAAGSGSDVVFISISGTASLGPLVEAVKAGKIIALASKEPIVSAGKIIMNMVREHSARILPVDSEHSAIMQCLREIDTKAIEKLYITGSGGSLWNKEKDEFDLLSVEEVLDHPKWNMGRKITVDSATLMNKGLEMIEARWLFDVAPEKIKLVIHPEAIVHSMVEFVDGTISASLFYPDMKFPILKALSYPDIIKNNFPKVDFSVENILSFAEPDRTKFPALDIAYNALKKGGTSPCVLNASNETAVGLFLDRKIKFTRIMKLVEEVLRKHNRISDPSLEEIVDSEKWASEEVLRSC
ncbi:MAG: 1-deoxy-D-xylulose-5-phosphate reductoisomerase [Candidatus Omnitrophota bacterium]